MNTSSKAILAILVIAIAVAWLIYRYSPDRNRMESRTQDEKEYVYKCNAGHVFSAFGRKSPRQCANTDCREEAYLYMVFSCPKGDRIGILLKTNPDEYRFDGYSSNINWQPFDIDEFFKVPCPECSTPGLRPAPESPG